MIEEENSPYVEAETKDMALAMDKDKDKAMGEDMGKDMGKDMDADKGRPVAGSRKTGQEEAQENNDVSFKKLVNAAVLLVLVALVFIALFSFFFSMKEAIIALFHPRYQALMQALFSLIVLVLGIYMIRLLMSNKR